MSSTNRHISPQRFYKILARYEMKNDERKYKLKEFFVNNVPSGKTQLMWEYIAHYCDVEPRTVKGYSELRHQS